MTPMEFLQSRPDLNRPIQVDSAVDLALRYGMIDGDHHKQWVIDQMLRVLLGDDYGAVIANHDADTDYDKWDIGIAP